MSPLEVMQQNAVNAQRLAHERNLQNAANFGGGRLKLNPLEQLAHVDPPDPSQAFIARNLIQRAQAELDAAIARGDHLAAAVARADEHRVRAETAEAKLRALQPKLRALVVPRGTPARIQYEPTNLWFFTSWALIGAGVIVCLL